jgi:hypothetical protein
MPYVNVPKDLTKVKTKVALGLTKRQLICFSSPPSSAFPCIFSQGAPSAVLSRCCS